jgi:hypothetical protein
MASKNIKYVDNYSNVLLFNCIISFKCSQDDRVKDYHGRGQGM